MLHKTFAKGLHSSGFLLADKVFIDDHTALLKTDTKKNQKMYDEKCLLTIARIGCLQDKQCLSTFKGIEKFDNKEEG